MGEALFIFLERYLEVAPHLSSKGDNDERFKQSRQAYEHNPNAQASSSGAHWIGRYCSAFSDGFCWLKCDKAVKGAPLFTTDEKLPAPIEDR